MANTYLGFPFDDDIFIRAWHDEPDPVRIALINSGVLVEDPRITGALQTDGNYFTVPFYNPLPSGGDGTSSFGPHNYDGATNVPVIETSGGVFSGVAYGRTQGFRERDFIPELSGSDPMGHIVRKVSDFWNRYRQSKLVGILEGVMGVTTSDWNTTHVKTVQKPAYIEKLPAVLNTALTEIFGQLKSDISVLVMDSLTAAEFENINLLHFERGVNAGAMLRGPQIGQMLGYTVIVDDTAMAGVSDGHIYALGSGALLTGSPRLDRPAELVRDAITYGGNTVLVTRMRDVIHPNGFKFTIPQSGWTESPTDAQLIDTANYDLVYNKDTVMIAKIKLTDGAAGPGDDAIKVYVTGTETPLDVKIDDTEPIEVVIANEDPIEVEVSNYEDFDFEDTPEATP